MTLQERMIMYRAKNRISQAELAKRCGLSKMTVNQIETGAQKPSKVTQAKIMLVVGGENDETVSE